MFLVHHLRSPSTFIWYSKISVRSHKTARLSHLNTTKMADIDNVSRSSLEDEEEKAALWPHSPEENFPEAERLKDKSTQRRLVCLNVAMLCFSITMLVLAGVLRYGPEYTGRNTLLKKTSAYCTY